MTEPTKSQVKKPISSKDISVNRLGQFAGFAVIEHKPTKTLRVLPSEQFPTYVLFGQRMLPTVFDISQSEFEKLAPPVPLTDLGFGKDIQYGVERNLASLGIINWKESDLDSNKIRGAADAAHRLVTRKLQELSNQG